MFIQRAKALVIPYLGTPEKEGTRGEAAPWVRLKQPEQPQPRAAPPRPVSVATRKPSAGRQLLAAPWLLSARPDHSKVRVSDCPSAAQRVTDSFVAERSRSPRHSVCPHILPRGRDRAPFSPRGAGPWRCPSGSPAEPAGARTQPWPGDTSSRSRRCPRDGAVCQGPCPRPGFLPAPRESVCHEQRSAAVRGLQRPPSRSPARRHRLQLPPRTHSAKLLRGTGSCSKQPGTPLTPRKNQVIVPNLPPAPSAGLLSVPNRAAEGLGAPADPPAPRRGSGEPAHTWLFLQPEASFLPSGDQAMLSTQCR